ncbi:MAG: hypothetical protein WDZ69_01080 [Candidatus Pacearchaeota archaeon]
MVTSIQLNEDVKKALDRLKIGKETYESIIIKMLNQVEKKEMERKELMIEGAKEMAEGNLKITREFESIEDLNKWRW